MTSLFRSNSPSKRANGKASNRPKFPFILMPVTDIGDRGAVVDECDPPISPSVRLEPPPQFLHDNAEKAARRNAVVHQELRSRFPPLSSASGLMEQYSAQEQIRRTAQTLYPTTSQANLSKDTGYQGASGRSEDTLLFNGLPVSRQQFQAIAIPRLCSRNRGAPKFRTEQSHVDCDASTPPRVVSASNSTSKLFGQAICSGGDKQDWSPETSDSKEEQCRQRVYLELQLQKKDKEIEQLKLVQAQLKTTLKETAIEAQTIKAQQETLRHEFATLENHFDSLEDKFDTQDEIANMRDILTQARISNQLLGANRSPMSNPLDFDRLISMTHELNSIAGNYQALEIGYTNVGATFKRPNSITLTLFRNGLTLDTNSFRPYTSISTIQFIQDIYDGYFPTELQSKYPDGITIFIKDDRYTIHPGGLNFPGEGRKLCDHVEFFPKFYPGKQLKSQTTPLKIQLESRCSTTTTPSKRATTYVHLPDLLPNTKSDSQTQRSLYKTQRNKYIVLKLKNLTTETSYKLKTSGSVTPDEILRHLETQLEILSPSEDGNYRKYQLLNSVPFGLFSLGDTSLRSYGITSNALLYFRPI